MVTEISQSKTICILAIVAGCFAILWPSLFYPMLKGSFAPHSHTGKLKKTFIYKNLIYLFTFLEFGK